MASPTLELDKKATKQGKISTKGKAKLSFEVDVNGKTRLNHCTISEHTCHTFFSSPLSGSSYYMGNC